MDAVSISPFVQLAHPGQPLHDELAAASVTKSKLPQRPQ